MEWLTPSLSQTLHRHVESWYGTIDALAADQCSGGSESTPTGMPSSRLEHA